MRFIVIILLCILLIQFSNVHALAQEGAPAVLAPSESSVSSAGSLDYELPYPGILPDNPLYVFKALRDRIISFLISDPLKKAEFNLLQADKRLQAGVYLMQKKQKKEQLALTTISKGMKYLESAVSSATEAKKQGMDTRDIFIRVSLSLKKHHQVLSALKEKSSVRQKAEFDMFLKKLREIEKMVNSKNH